MTFTDLYEVEQNMLSSELGCVLEGDLILWVVSFFPSFSKKRGGDGGADWEE